MFPQWFVLEWHSGVSKPFNLHDRVSVIVNLHANVHIDVHVDGGVRVSVCLNTGWCVEVDMYVHVDHLQCAYYVPENRRNGRVNPGSTHSRIRLA